MMNFAGLGCVAGFITIMLTASASVINEPESFKDCPNCPEMVVMPTGVFHMGTPDSVTQKEGVKTKRAKRERPVHPRPDQTQIRARQV